MSKKISIVRKKDSYGYTFGEQILFGKKVIFSTGITTSTNCCGLGELHEFGYHECNSLENIQSEFNEGMEELIQQKFSSYGVLTLTLTAGDAERNLGDPYDEEEFPCHQPNLLRWLQQRENVVHSEWKVNPNSGNFIQTWLISK